MQRVVERVLSEILKQVENSALEREQQGVGEEDQMDTDATIDSVPILKVGCLNIVSARARALS